MKGQAQKSQVLKRSIVIEGHKTSISLEDAFWNALREIAVTRNVPLSDLIATINKERQHANLSSVLRLFVLDHYRALAVPPAVQPKRRRMKKAARFAGRA
jgi:predicted DNA-binding ribbon-helix-helix protein